MRGVPLCLFALVAACTGTDTGPGGAVVCPTNDCATVVFDPTRAPTGETQAADWLSFPFPSDLRRTPNNLADYSDFPNPDGESLLEEFIDHATENLDGFGLNAPVYVRLSETPDLDSLPDPAEAAHSHAAVQLIDLATGERTPVRWEFFELEGKFVPANTLAVAPEWGFPLRESTPYALLITDTLLDLNGDRFAPTELVRHLFGWGGDVNEFDRGIVTALESQFQPLRSTLENDGFDTTAVVAATVFTTQSIVPELAALRQSVADRAAPTPHANGWQAIGENGLSWRAHQLEWDASGSVVDYWELEGRYTGPNYQAGDVPYVTKRSGGGFNIVDGTPQPAHEEDLTFVITVPAEPPREGPCYPIIEYSHGIGADAHTHVGETGGRLAARGLATIGIDQPLHGDRWNQSNNIAALSLYSFNVFNPAAARTLFRQAAVDTFALTRMLDAGFTIPAAHSPTGSEICFDPDRIGYFGHSQGALTGELAAAVESDIDAWLFSGGGGGLSITLFERDDSFIDTQALLNVILRGEPGEAFTENHPVVGLIQTLSDITDPINYAPYWHHDTRYSDANHFLVTSAELDSATPFRTATAMAVAARIPVVAPVTVPAPTMALADLSSVPAPVTANAAGKTVAFVQWANDTGFTSEAGHFVVFYRPEAIHASMHFFETWAGDGVPSVVREPNSEAR